ncbi:hypothetical protein [Xanthobacter sediminis]
MTAFNLEVLLLLLVAFVLGLALGLWLRRSRRRASEREVMVSVPADLPAARARPEGMPSAGAEEGAAPVPPAEAPSASDAAPARSDAPAPAEAAPPGAAAPQAPREEPRDLPSPREPVADLFGHLLNVPPGTVVEEPESEPERPRRGAGAAVRENHPGVPPPVLPAPEGGVAEDLKLLKGIGPQNEQKLHALGIFHFRQIAAWTPEEAAWVGSYLAFPGRIEREDWIGQAQALAAGAPAEARTSRKPKGEG